MRWTTGTHAPFGTYNIIKGGRGRSLSQNTGRPTLYWGPAGQRGCTNFLLVLFDFFAKLSSRLSAFWGWFPPTKCNISFRPLLTASSKDFGTHVCCHRWGSMPRPSPGHFIGSMSSIEHTTRTQDGDKHAQWRCRAQKLMNDPRTSFDLLLGRLWLSLRLLVSLAPLECTDTLVLGV